MKRSGATRNARLKQYTYEAETWNRMLVFCKEELAHYKTRLAGLLADSGADEDVLLSAETFQEDFLAQEKDMLYLTDELKQQDRRLQKDLYLDGELYKEVVRTQKRLRHLLKKADERFTEIKHRYDRYLHERYPAEA
jgi:hypothetical protein